MSDPSANDAYFYKFRAMGTFCTLRLMADTREQADMWAALAAAEVERIESKYSRYKSDSALSAINKEAGTGNLVTIDDETSGLIDFAFACYHKSDGLFDITSGVLRRAWSFNSQSLPDPRVIDALLPLIGQDKLYWKKPYLSLPLAGMEIDFGGIGKEYAVDRVATVLRDEGVNQALIDLGGDMFALDSCKDGLAWKVELCDPFHPTEVMGSVVLIAGALATSGDYERCIEINGKKYGHVLDPHTGWPTQGLSSVTVMASQCMVAGGLTTIAMLKGEHGRQWLETIEAPFLWVDDKNRRGGTLSMTPY